MHFQVSNICTHIYFASDTFRLLGTFPLERIWLKIYWFSRWKVKPLKGEFSNFANLSHPITHVVIWEGTMTLKFSTHGVLRSRRQRHKPLSERKKLEPSSKLNRSSNTQSSNSKTTSKQLWHCLGWLCDSQLSKMYLLISLNGLWL